MDNTTSNTLALTSIWVLYVEAAYVTPRHLITPKFHKTSISVNKNIELCYKILELQPRRAEMP